MGSEGNDARAQRNREIGLRLGLIYEKGIIAGLTSAERVELAKMIRLLKRRRKLGLSGPPEEYKEDAHYFTTTCWLLIRADRMLNYYRARYRMKKNSKAFMRYLEKEDPESYRLFRYEDNNTWRHSNTPVGMDRAAIAQKVGDTGELYGPGAEKWQPFNDEYFLMPTPRPNSL
jgi:hypothetical protein